MYLALDAKYWILVSGVVTLWYSAEKDRFRDDHEVNVVHNLNFFVKINK